MELKGTDITSSLVALVSFRQGSRDLRCAKVEVPMDKVVGVGTFERRFLCES